MILLKFVKIRISFQVNSQLTERREKLLRNCMQQNVVECVTHSVSQYANSFFHYRLPVTSALVVMDHPKMTYRRSMLCCRDRSKNTSFASDSILNKLKPFPIPSAE